MRHERGSGTGGMIGIIQPRDRRGGVSQTVEGSRNGNDDHCWRGPNPQLPEEEGGPRGARRRAHPPSSGFGRLGGGGQWDGISTEEKMDLDPPSPPPRKYLRIRANGGPKHVPSINRTRKPRTLDRTLPGSGSQQPRRGPVGCFFRRPSGPNEAPWERFPICLREPCPPPNWCCSKCTEGR